MLALVEVFFTPLHSAATFGVRTRVPTTDLNELGFKVMRKRYTLNALLMLRTSGCRRYILKVACRLNVRGVSPQSRPRCMVDQPTCETVKRTIVNVHLTFTDHPTFKTLGHISRSHPRL
jgi:hypothetical protein